MPEMSHPGYVCAPYLHDHGSVGLKEDWEASPNVEGLYFVTGTFSGDSVPYFADPVNHYLLARFRDSSEMGADMEGRAREKTAFMFSISDGLFEREVVGGTNFVSVYYLEYGEGGEDLQEIANLLMRRERIEKAGLGSMRTYCTEPQRFTFPYSESMVVIEVAGQKGHQSLKKYCDQIRREVNRKGLTMTNMMSLSLIERLK